MDYMIPGYLEKSLMKYPQRFLKKEFSVEIN